MTEAQFVVVSGWMKNGNINEFLKANTSIDRLGLVCSFIKNLYLHLLLTIAQLLQLKDITNALTYMHDQGIIHGNLKGVSFMNPVVIVNAAYPAPSQIS